MRPTAPYPCYYIPVGIAKPKHCPWLAPAQLIPDASPDGSDGFYWGGAPYDPRSKEYWRKTAEGWYLLIEGRDPGHLARTAVITGPVVTGINELQLWMVPQLLRWHPEAALISAIPEVLRVNEHGTYEWAPPAHLIGIMDRLRAMMLLGVSESVRVINDEEARDLAIDILALNYHVSIHELAIAEWMSTELVKRVIEAASGLLELKEQLKAKTGASAG